MAEHTASLRNATAFQIATVYLSAFLQGLTLVSFPASSGVLKDMHGFTDAQYGLIFLPQVALAVIGAVAGGTLARSLRLDMLLWISLLINGASQLLLASTVLLTPAMAFAGILTGTALLGLGFGLSGAPLNSYPPRFFPAQRDTALVALHTILGLGLAAGPLFASWMIANGAWGMFPVSLLAISFLLALSVLWLRWPFGNERTAVSTSVGVALPAERPVGSAAFWTFFVIAILYAFAEGTFSSWAVIYLQEAKRLPMEVAALALSTFWIAMVAGRLAVSIAVLWIPAERIWLSLPVLMICAFLLLPYANTSILGIALFALAGLACSGFFPLTVGLISKRFDMHVAWVSSMMIAALMVGVGLGSFLIGILRSQLTLEQLYQFSALYPLLVLVLGMVLQRSRKPRTASIESASA